MRPNSLWSVTGVQALGTHASSVLIRSEDIRKPGRRKLVHSEAGALETSATGSSALTASALENGQAEKRAHLEACMLEA